MTSNCLEMSFGLYWYYKTDVLIWPQIDTFIAVCFSLWRQMTSICFKTAKSELPWEDESQYLKHSNVIWALELKQSSRCIAWRYPSRPAYLTILHIIIFL